MLTNATIIRLDQPADGGPSGQQAWTNGPAIAARCCIESGVQQDRYPADLRLSETASALLQVNSGTLAAAMNLASQGGQLGVECRLSVQPDGQASATVYRVRKIAIRTKGWMSYFECALMVD